MAGFMQLSVWQEEGIEVVYPIDGETILPRSYLESDELIDLDWVSAGELWWAEYTAPGYMDKTPATYAECPYQAARDCFELFADAADESDRNELANLYRELRKRGIKRNR